MHPIFVLWATPRTTSTAFEWMMRMRGDMACFHEPFGEPWYRGVDVMSPRPAPQSRRRPDISFDTVLADLRTAATERPVFAKDMPQFTGHRWTPEFLAACQHSFLIRDPAKVMMSLHRSYEKSGDSVGFTDVELGFEEQRRLFDLLRERDGVVPIVVDSDDLLADPKTVVQRYCEAIGIPFIAEALSWEPGDRDEVLWFNSDVDVWHASLRDSDGLRAQPRASADISDHPHICSRNSKPFFRTMFICTPTGSRPAEGPSGPCRRHESGRELRGVPVQSLPYRLSP